MQNFDMIPIWNIIYNNLLKYLPTGHKLVESMLFGCYLSTLLDCDVESKF